ncbi:MAG: peptidoglycan editing factor PgeF [Pseudomonadota bacterium]
MSTLSPVLADELSAMPGISHGFFTRTGGVSEGIYAGLNAGLGSGDDRAKVVENRRRIALHLGVKEQNIASPYQIHSAFAVTTDKPWSDDRPKVDGVATATPGLALGIVTADCGPVLFADTQNNVIGACHAGWKGALTGVLEATLDAMETLGANRKDITAILGPSISQENYEVGPEFPAPFIEQSEDNGRYFIPSQKPDHHMFDLSRYIVDRLAKASVGASDMVDVCTYASEDFFSYRRTTHRGEPDYGRQLSAITLME